MIRTRAALPAAPIVAPLAALVLAALVLAALVLAAPAAAWAQAGLSTGGNPANSTPSFGAPGKSKVEREKREPAPPALPGARAEPDVVAPPTKTAAEMPPTEALFDSINRGDLPGAKDAVNRGAELDGRNVLGLTPIELSVDLGRNQISFFLLSLRGASGYTTTTGPAVAPKPPTRAERLAADRAIALQARQEAATERSRNRQAAIAPAAPQTARLFAGDGGAPVPQAGFLGFGH